MNPGRRRFLALAAGAALLVGVAIPWLPRRFHYLPGDTTEFVALFAAPPARASAEERRELDQLLEMQRLRTHAQVESARADRRKDVERFYLALGIDAQHPPDLPHLQAFTDAAEADIGPYVRAVKEKYRRLRPYEVEPRLEPCIGDVQGDLSYPSGHATYGFVMAYLLADLVPERRAALEARGAEYARQRMLCGVHFPSDIDAAMIGARWLVAAFGRNERFVADAQAARRELRAALALR